MTREITARDLKIGGSAPVSVQSMTNTDPHDLEATLSQVRALEAAGAELVRLTVPDAQAARVLGGVRERVGIPLCADIHFDYRAALEAVAAGADKLRINPGNIGAPERVRAVANACSAAGIAIRIGVNGGSLERRLLAEFGGPTPEALVKSATEQAKMLEGYGFGDICISVKASDVRRTVRANMLLSEQTDYPLHIGVTEAGRGQTALVRSAAGIGGLLAMGVGNTIRVSMTGDPVAEVGAGIAILKACGLRGGINLVSCPTCGRTRVDLDGLTAEVERRIAELDTDKSLTVAVMGCAVNGPGEAREADVGLAGGDGELLLFIKGEIIRKIPQADAADELLKEIKKLLGDK
ncbi:MAG: flavodoxin-dependent (E)-4-hydroxy-3-methylbut-2-enyl-diphosphate synthase [Clostridia bacterium]|nr:flavodoxin-dependent (E)-4-hydroxy-3-methylbut-2-enyl-diphosphate synthase [Clostridia bacterium]